MSEEQSAVETTGGTPPTAGADSGSSQKSLLTGIGALVVLIAIGVGGYFLFFSKKVTPQEVIQKAIVATMNATRATSSGELSINWDVPVKNRAQLQQELPFLQIPPEGGVMSMSMDMKVSGSADESVPGKEQSKGTLELNLSASGLSMKAAIATRTKDGVLYLQLNEVPVILDALGLSSLRGQWLKIDVKTLMEQATAIRPGSSTLPNDEKLKAMTETIREQTGVLLEKHPIFLVTEVLPNETVHGVSAYHYKFKFDKANVGAFIKDELEMITRASATAGNVDAKELDKSLTEMRKDYAKIDQLELKGVGELWIGVADAYLHKLTFIADETSLDVADPKEGQKVKIRGQVSLEMKDYGLALTVEEPKDATPIEQIFGPLFKSIGGASGPH